MGLGQGWIQLDVAPELLREGQRLQLHAFGRTAAIDEMETQAARLARVHRAKGVQPAGALMVSCLDRGEQLYGEEGVETACEPRELLSLGSLRRQQVAKPRWFVGRFAAPRDSTRSPAS